MGTLESLEFVNRGAELAFLTTCLRHPKPLPALVVIRSPAGFGKSRLTDQIVAKSDVTHATTIVVDPSVRAKIGSARMHEGFFVQRCAEALSDVGRSSGIWLVLSAFLKDRRWRTVAEKKQIDNVSELPGLRQGYRVAFDYTQRIFGFGRFSTSQILASDQSDAVRICTEYVEQVLKNNSTILIVREAQHCDLYSLRLLLQINQTASSSDLIFEYTSDVAQFESEHQKLFMRTADSHHNFHILDLFRLEPNHLEYLIRQNIRSDFHLTSAFYLSWNGNLNSVIELKFQVGIGRQITSVAQIESVLGNLEKTLETHVESLSSLQRLILAIALAHVEAIDRSTLERVVVALDPRSTSKFVSRSLRELIDTHGFLSMRGNVIAIKNESVANSIGDTRSFRPLEALAQKALRDYYMKLVAQAAYDGTGLALSVRQVFRLCAKTKDVAGLLSAIESLSDQVKRSQDQSIYVDAVVGAIETDRDLYAGDSEALLTWAASLAYELSDWERSASLLAAKSDHTCFSLSMRAFALQEIGGHDEALHLAKRIRAEALHGDDVLSADLIEAVVLGCRGDQPGARFALNKILQNPANQTSPMVGYAYRLFEITEDYAESVEKLRASIASFDRFGFSKSKAYSQLAMAVLIARLGDIEVARTTISEAQHTLTNEVRDQHMILNNRAAIEMLSDYPNFDGCKKLLSEALRYARDDYSELTILTNLCLAYWGASELEAALDCIERSLAILAEHDFADEDVYWPVCFNAGQIFAALGLLDRRDEILDLPRSKKLTVSVNQNYWAFRFGEVAKVEEQYRFLASRPRHPLYLSHWLIDLDGLNLLKRARLR